EHHLGLGFSERALRYPDVSDELCRGTTLVPFSGIRRNRHGGGSELRRESIPLFRRHRDRHPIRRLRQIHRPLPDHEILVTLDRHHITSVPARAAPGHLVGAYLPASDPLGPASDPDPALCPLASTSRHSSAPSP